MFKVSAHQPSLAPWAGFWNKLYRSDEMVLLAGYPYDHAEPVRRVKVQGRWAGLEVKAHQRTLNLNQVLVSDGAAKALARQLEGLLLQNKQLKYRDRVAPVVQFLNGAVIENLYSINTELLVLVRDMLGIAVPFTLSYTPSTPVVTDGLRSIVTMANGHDFRQKGYLSGAGGRAYLDEESMAPHFVSFQQVRPHVMDESILDIMARERDPLDYVATAADWT